MSDADLAKVAFALHEKGLLPKRDLVRVLQKLINNTARSNGYAERYGFPFPERNKR